MLALVQSLPRESATVRAITGDAAEWGAAEHLLAHIADLLASANWQRGGGKGSRPKPLQRPGRTVLEEHSETLGVGSWSVQEMREKLARLRGRAPSN